MQYFYRCKMKKKHYLISALFLVLVNPLYVSCKKTENPIVYEKGIFPDTLLPLTGLNSAYDDYNLNIYTLNNYLPVIFSSNRLSSGEQFDLVQGVVTYIFNQTTGEFLLQSENNNNPFFTELTTRLSTDKDDFGPYRLYSSLDGYEYTIVSSVNENGNLDFNYVMNLPYFGAVVPSVFGPFLAVKLNSGSNDAYFCFDTNQDSAYYTSDADGDFNIYVLKRDPSVKIETWLNSAWAAPQKVNVLNSAVNDKCPWIFRKIMVFASDRDGGFGGYDLYYSRFKNGNWETPVNMGPEINSSSDEYRPILSGDENFSNMFLMFSSNRPGGLGGFDLYFTGITL